MNSYVRVGPRSLPAITAQRFRCRHVGRGCGHPKRRTWLGAIRAIRQGSPVPELRRVALPGRKRAAGTVRTRRKGRQTARCGRSRTTGFGAAEAIRLVHVSERNVCLSDRRAALSGNRVRMGCAWGAGQYDDLRAFEKHNADAMTNCGSLTSGMPISVAEGRAHAVGGAVVVTVNGTLVIRIPGQSQCVVETVGGRVRLAAVARNG